MHARFVELLPNILYLIGCVCFFVGTAMSIVRTIRGV